MTRLLHNAESSRPDGRMTQLKGVFINLDDQRERRSRLERHLGQLGLEGRYQRFSAVRGDPDRARERGLNPGEFGLWQSWLDLLQSASASEGFDYLHIVEDDVELSREFVVFSEGLNPDGGAFDLLVTDMYVNPSIHRALALQHDQQRRQRVIDVRSDLYTGCLASVLIHRQRIGPVLEQLKQPFEATCRLLPLDNALRQLQQQGKLRIARTLPFLTGVQPDSITRSSIQPRQQQDAEVLLTQRICSNLRRQLSVLCHNKLTAELADLLEQLAKTRGPDQGWSTRIGISQTLMDLADQQDLLRFASDPRLFDQPDNPQQAG